MDPLTMSLLAFGGGELGKMFTKSPQFNSLQGNYGVNGNYQYDAKTNFGQDTAKDNMNRYGFQGVYQKYLEGETERMKQDEMRRIQKLASGLVPGQASLRGGVAVQGMNGSVSNVIAQQQREQGLGKALDAAGNEIESSNARLDSNLFQATQGNEQLRFGASQDYMKSLGLESEAENTEGRYNADSRFRSDSFNQEMNFKRDSFNAQGEFQEDKGESDKWNDIFGDFAGIGVSMLGQEYAKYLNPSTPGVPAQTTNSGVPKFGVPDYNRPTSGISSPGWKYVNGKLVRG